MKKIYVSTNVKAKKIYVVHWTFYDKSGSGVMEEAYIDKEEAQRISDMLNIHGSRSYCVQPVLLKDA